MDRMMELKAAEIMIAIERSNPKIKVMRVHYDDDEECWYAYCYWYFYEAEKENCPFEIRLGLSASHILSFFRSIKPPH